MAQILVMPKYGQTVEESTIVKWRVKEGDVVRKGDILFEIETDKAAMEVESFFEGTILKILVGEGATVPVSSPVAFIGKPGEPLPELPPAGASSPAPKPAGEAGPVTAAKTAGEAPKPSPKAPGDITPSTPSTMSIPTSTTPATPSAAPKRLFASPRARVLAKSAALDIARIPGTGPDGRIVEKDVAAYMEKYQVAAIKITPAAKQKAIAEGVDILTVRATGEGARIVTADIDRALEERPKTMSKMRQIIAERLTRSTTSIPHFYVTVSVDMTDLLGLRKGLKAAGKAYTVTDFILEAVVLALGEKPAFNSVTDGKTVRWNSAVNLGMAVSLEQGLVVPVIRDAARLTLAELHDAAQALAVKAREGKLKPDEMTGSTFTISNMGMLNVENFTAIINPGESAILAVSSTLPTPVAREGRVVVRDIMKLTLSSDHRIIDGAQAAGFANAIKSKLEDMELWKSLT
ncbi:MAG: dihydrolipoamide acetyltransferase family protein [Kiritimatiellia bacterium]